MALWKITKLIASLLFLEYCSANLEPPDVIEHISESDFNSAAETVADLLSEARKRQVRANSWGYSPWGVARPPPGSQVPQQAPPVPPVAPTPSGPGNPQMKCTLKRFEGVYFYGKLNSVAKNVETLNTCVAVCWQLKSKGRRCGSVNYVKIQNKCEIMDDQLNTQKTYQLQYLTENNQNSVYVVPILCSESTSSSGGQTPPPQGSSPPTTAPVPPTPPKAVPDRELPPAGTCGVTDVEPRISEDVLSGRSSLRIIGGAEARPHSFPWLASLQEFGDHFCGGTLIRVSPTKEESDIILTAAHCLHDKPTGLKIALGAHNIKNPAAGQQKIAAEKYLWHEAYDKDTVVNDVGLVKLKEPVQFSRTIQPACLPIYGEKVVEGQIAVVAGWGSMQETINRMPDVLMQVPVNVLNYDLCDKKFYPGEMFAPQMFCAGHVQGGRDSCQGDSGGPLIFKTQKGWMTRGVVSFGEGCARAGKPGVYANLSNYIPWIRDRIAELTSVKD